MLLCLFPGVLWLWHFLYSVGPHTVSSINIYTFVVSRAFMAGAASQAGDADSSSAPGLTSGLHGSVNVHRGALLLVPQWRCISSFVFYICDRVFLSKYEMNLNTNRDFLLDESYLRPPSFNAISMYMHLSPWINVMFDFICMRFVERNGKKAKFKMKRQFLI